MKPYYIKSWSLFIARSLRVIKLQLGFKVCIVLLPNCKVLHVLISIFIFNYFWSFGFLVFYCLATFDLYC